MAKLNNKQESTQKSETEFKNITENGGIEIRFIGKTNALRIVRKVKPWTLKEITELSIGSEKEKSKNLVIEGDNLKAMSSLYQYHGKIDLILTDPPYNTGKDFRYNDKWDEEPNDEGLGDYVKSDDPSRHTKWLKFMVPRLQVMKKMLKLGGVLAICIDERELSRLLPLLDEEKIMFGEENRLAIISWQKAYAPKKTNHVSTATEHVLVYTKSLEKSATGKLEQTEIQKSRFTNPDNDPKGEWRSTTSLIRGGNKNCIYAIQNPFTGLLMYPYEGSSWRYSRKTMKSFLEEWGSEYEERNLENNNTSSLILKGFNLKNLENLEKDPVFQQARKKANEIYNRGAWPRLIYLRKGLGKIQFKSYFAEVKEGVAPLNWWDYEDDAGGISWHQQISGYTQQGTAELKARVEFESDFIGVKPLKLFTKIIQLWCPEGGLVMDPFAGSGTTGNAVLELNNLSKEVERERERERERWFILIEQGFNIKEEDKKEKNYCRTLLQKRLKAVITGQWADGKLHGSLRGGFRFFELTKQLDSSTILQMEKQELTEAILSSNLNHTPLPNNSYLIAKNKQSEGIYLIWESNGKKRESKITEKVYHRCVLEQEKNNLAPIYHIYARNTNYQTSTVVFHKIPDKVLIDFGVDPTTDTFINNKE